MERLFEATLKPVICLVLSCLGSFSCHLPRHVLLPCSPTPGTQKLRNNICISTFTNLPKTKVIEIMLFYQITRLAIRWICGVNSFRH